MTNEDLETIQKQWEEEYREEAFRSKMGVGQDEWVKQAVASGRQTLAEANKNARRLAKQLGYAKRQREADQQIETGRRWVKAAEARQRAESARGE